MCEWCNVLVFVIKNPSYSFFFLNSDSLHNPLFFLCKIQHLLLYSKRIILFSSIIVWVMHIAGWFFTHDKFITVPPVGLTGVRNKLLRRLPLRPAPFMLGAGEGANMVSLHNKSPSLWFCVCIIVCLSGLYPPHTVWCASWFRTIRRQESKTGSVFLLITWRISGSLCLISVW